MLRMIIYVAFILMIILIIKQVKKIIKKSDSSRQDSDFGREFNNNASHNHESQAELPKEITCPQCGNRIIKEDLFCGNCGKKFQLE